MTKSELKTGMIVTRRDGKKLTVYRNCVCSNTHSIYNDALVDASALSWDPLKYFSEDLKHKDYPEFDIVKVEIVKHPYDYNKHPECADIYGTIWEGNNAKKMTIAEIESILGYKIEIISEQ